MSVPILSECAWVKPTEGIVPDDIELPDYPFGSIRKINSKIYLFCGDIYQLPADAFVVGQNEALTDMNDGNDALIALAGPELEKELALSGPIQTGEAVITKGGSLPCDFVIHAVGPKFDERYLTASDHALFAAYKAALLLAVENNCKKININCIYMRKKKYPRFEAAHVALRTIRKFLNHSLGDALERIVLCVPTQDDYEIYSALLCAYFPRSLEEMDMQSTMLPENLGDAWGEIIINERVLKVSAGPTPLRQEELEEYRQVEVPTRTSQSSAHGSDGGAAGGGGGGDGSTATSSVAKTGKKFVPLVQEDYVPGMQDIGYDRDAERANKIAEEFARMSKEERLRLKYHHMLNDLEGDTFEDMAALGFLHFAGSDFRGNTVVWITACKLVMLSVDMDRVLLYFMFLMEHMRCRPFVLVYANSAVNEDNNPESHFLQAIFDLFAARYKENMQQLYILHAGFFFRMYIWLALPFLATPFWSNYVVVENLAALKEYMDIDKLDIPERVLQYDEDTYPTNK